MVKSDLVQHIAGQNPHLYRRDIENVVNAVLGEITTALARGRPDRIARFRCVLDQASPSAHRAQSAHAARMCRSTRSRWPFFKTGKEMHERLNKA